jgi:SOS response regulatory protein OraA/RecX
VSGESGDNEDFTAADVRRTAMNLLARREYARRELAARLASRGLPGDLIDPVMDELTQENLLSDDRFADAFVSARAGRGQGPVRIRIELEQKGVDPEIVERALGPAASRSGPGRPVFSSTVVSPPSTWEGCWATRTESVGLACRPFTA